MTQLVTSKDAIILFVSDVLALDPRIFIIPPIDKNLY